MSAGKIHDSLNKSYPECVSITGKTEIKQIINKKFESQIRANQNT